jgi:membrane protein YdbS with pleckstrin-like domain
LWLVAGVVLIALPVIIRVYHNEWMATSFNLTMIVIGLLLLAIPWLRAKRYRFRITNYRIDFERGLLGRNIDTLELWHVEDLRFHQSLMARILGVGTITVLSKHPTTPVLIIPSIPNAQALFKTLEQRVIAVKRQAGVIKVDTGSVGNT